MASYFKGKADPAVTAKANAALDEPTLGAALVAAGIKTRDTSTVDRKASNAVLLYWNDYKYGPSGDWRFEAGDAQAAIAGMDGLPDETFGLNVIGQATIQSTAKIDYSLDEVLQTIADEDPAAADLIAEICTASQEGKSYYGAFLSAVNKHAWRGMRTGIKLLAQGAGAALGAVTEGLGWPTVIGLLVAFAVYRGIAQSTKDTITGAAGAVRNPRRPLGVL